MMVRVADDYFGLISDFGGLQGNWTLKWAFRHISFSCGILINQQPTAGVSEKAN